MMVKVRYKERQAMVYDFQKKYVTSSSTASTILAGAHSIVGTGHTLPRALKIIITDPDILIVAEQQATFHFSRIGTINETLCIILEDSDVLVELKIKETQWRRGSRAKMTACSQKDIDERKSRRGLMMRKRGILCSCM